MIAGVILEPVLMNCGILVPEDRFPRRPASPDPQPRGLVDLRRGQDGADCRPGRRHQDVRGPTGHRLPGQGARRADFRWRRSVAPRKS